MLKTISFSARPEALHSFLKRLEGRLRQEIAELEEEAAFDGHETRFAIGIAASPADED
jgi:hypothetical protein